MTVKKKQDGETPAVKTTGGNVNAASSGKKNTAANKNKKKSTTVFNADGSVNYESYTRAKSGKTEQLIGVIVVIVIILLIGGGVTWWAVSNHNKKVAQETALTESQSALADVTNVPSKFTDDGALVFVGNKLIDPADESEYEDLVPVDVYMDYNCPGCGSAERTLGDTYEELMNENKIRLRIHPIAFLNNTSTDKYSERAANAVIKVAQEDPDHVIDYIRYIMSEDIQPQEGSDYVPVSDEQLQEWAKDAGVTVDDYTTLTDEEYDDWLMAMTNYTTNRPELVRSDIGSFATPLITVDGTQMSLSSGVTNQQLIQNLEDLVDKAASK